MTKKTCLRCSHSWTSLVDHPSACPKCKSYRWDKDPRPINNPKPKPKAKPIDEQETLEDTEDPFENLEESIEEAEEKPKIPGEEVLPNILKEENPFDKLEEKEREKAEDEFGF